MGSLPELRRLGASSPSPPPPARPTYNAPRHSVGAATTMQVRKASGTRQPLNVEGVSSVQGILAGGRRRESCASSVGAASVRRLVRTGTVGVEDAMAAPAATTIKAAAAACCARAFAAAAILPLHVLQGAHGLWGPGVPLLAGLHAASAIAALGAPAVLHIITIRRMVPVAYFLLAIFFAVHLYPKVYILIPAYLAMGCLWSFLSLAHSTLLTNLADNGFKNTGGNNCAVILPARKTLLRRMSRASRAARDLGLLIAAMCLPLLPPSSDSGKQPFESGYYHNTTNCVTENGNFSIGPCKIEVLHGNSSNAMDDNSILWLFKSNASQVNSSFEMWSPTETEDELENWRESWCGARACPEQDMKLDQDVDEDGSRSVLAIWLVSCCTLAALCALALPSMGRKTGPTPWKAAISALSEPRLKLVTPLAFFIGLEQGFLYAHLMQWYVACVSDAGQPWRALVGVALLRALVACTLSMLLAHGRRRLVVSVGLMWHACLLLALSLWRAARADRQLPAVMAAAWAGCDAVWELVQATFVDEPWCFGLSALCLSLRSAGLSLSLMGRWLLCARWSLRGLMLALPAAAIPLLFAADR